MSDKIELNSASAATAYEPGLYAIHYRDNWDGEGDTYHILAELSEDGTWSGHENGCKLLQFQGDEILQAWPLRHEAATAELSSIEAMCRMIEEREWAEHVGKGAIGRRVESVITTLHNELQDAQKAAAKQPAPVAVPDGWKLAPVEMTPEMRAAWDAAPKSEDDDEEMRSAYRAMLAAAPSATEPAASPAQEPAEVYAVRYLSHWDGEGDDVYVLAWKHDGELVTHEGGVKISDLLAYRGDKILNVWPLYTAPPAAEQPYSTTSDRYRAELYDEVWQKARGMGYGNVTEALIALERMKAAERERIERGQPDAVPMPRELLEYITTMGWLTQESWRKLNDLLGKESV